MRFLQLSFVFGLLILSFASKGDDLPMNPLPELLRKNADAVVILSKKEVVVTSESSLRVRFHQVITVLNHNGESAGELDLHYDKFVVPSDIRFQIYDQSGSLIKKVKQSEIRDFSDYDGFSLFTDNRVKYYHPVVGKYPYTVDYSYELSYRGYSSLPRWIPVTDYNLAIEKASFSIEYDTALNIRYKLLGFDKSPDMQTIKGKKRLEWELENFEAIKYEPYSPGIISRVPSVLLACNHFEYDGSKGDLSSWESFGKWILSLLQGRQELPETTKMKVKELTAGLSDDRQKADALYRYLQERMRYVSIQLGIGGYQPFTAAEVDKWNYGDCKALSNYYLALLTEAGIYGEYAVTIADDETPLFYRDFPANIYFNHIIVCIPFEKDTTWVECTNNYFPFGFVSRRVAGNPALLVTADGGKLVTVPVSPARNNNEFRKLEINLSKDGSAGLDLEIKYNGLQLTTGIGKFVESNVQQEKSLYQSFELNDFVISKHNYVYEKKRDASVVLTASLSCNRLATLSGDRLFVPVKILDSPWKIPEKIEHRTSPLLLQASYFDCDSVLIRFPEGYSIESLPGEYVSDSGFVSYHLQFVPGEKQLMIIRSVLVEERQFPPEKYDDFRQFLIAVNKAEKQKLILKKAN